MASGRNYFSLTNVIISIALVAILLLVYIKNKNFELFDSSYQSEDTTSTTPTTPTTPMTTISFLNNDIIQNSALVNFINKFITNKNKQSVYAATLANRQAIITDYTDKVLKLINPTV